MLLTKVGSEIVCRICLDNPEQPASQIVEIDINDPHVEVIDANGLRWPQVMQVNLKTGCIHYEDDDDNRQNAFIPTPIFLRPIL